ncbi:hypothetical protein EV361DRAFT_870006 [Lentinula raphanica]|nr:hypothetical protein EV361DRAFT_870006 [Lentinula raphanica]
MTGRLRWAESNDYIEVSPATSPNSSPLQSTSPLPTEQSPSSAEIVQSTLAAPTPPSAPSPPSTPSPLPPSTGSPPLKPSYVLQSVSSKIDALSTSPLGEPPKSSGSPPLKPHRSHEVQTASHEIPPTSLLLKPSSPVQPEVAIHEKLLYKQGDRQVAETLLYDLTEDPAAVMLNEELSKEPATTPPLPTLKIQAKGLPITITVNETETGKGVTVGVLLRALSERLQATPSDLKREAAKLLDRAFRERCAKLKEHNVAEAAKALEDGARWFDFLKGATIFAGLEDYGKEKADSVFTLRLHVVERSRLVAALA